MSDVRSRKNLFGISLSRNKYLLCNQPFQGEQGQLPTSVRPIWYRYDDLPPFLPSESEYHALQHHRIELGAAEFRVSIKAVWRVGNDDIAKIFRQILDAHLANISNSATIYHAASGENAFECLKRHIVRHSF